MRMNPILLLSLLVAPSIIAIEAWHHQDPAQSMSTVFSTHRGDGDGNLWLRWNQPERTAYVNGFLDGYNSGHQDGCEAAIDILVPTASQIRKKDPSRNCKNVEENWIKSQQNYADQISDFYTRYPAERDVPLPVMFWALSDANGWSVEKIHQWHLDLIKKAAKRPGAPGDK